ncbi:hypothetical protein JKF63_04271 [Porcisia hertigi]|uniref:Protein YIPF n=1 Tax=Porcisia hertigi TaxID=2761500 RepID=A0A836IS66_9TRYP|nr:hypothetical protein JKF63_04271 [Porcisia hertigi]
MAQQQPYRQYQGYAYPTEFQPVATGSHDGGASTSFGGVRMSPTPAPSLSGTTGLVRRSAQHAGASAASSASTGANATGHHNSYGYFHRQSSTVDFNSGYNSDVGSSASNALYGGGGRSGYPIPNSTLQPPEVVVGGPGQGPARGSCATSVEGSPGTWAAEPGVEGFFTGNGKSSELPPPLRGSGVHPASSEGSAVSIANHSGSVPPPVQQTFLSSETQMQSPPLPPQHSHRQNYHQQQQPYAVAVPLSSTSSPQRVTMSGVAPPAALFLQRNGPYVPSSGNPGSPSVRAAYDPSANPSATGGGMSSGYVRGGFWGRLVSQVLPALDDKTGDPKSGTGFDSVAAIGERPLYQLRFGNPADDLPLLEELGFSPRHILDKARAVLNPFKPISVDAAKDTDLAGPVVFAFSLALLLSLRGKIQFSAIYGLFVLGVVFFKMLLSLMQPNGDVPLQFVASTIGYGLLPTVLLAAVRSVGAWLMVLRGVLPLTLLMVAWSAWCGTTLVVKGLGMAEQRYLVLYPMFLLYSAFNAVAVY